jgi:hypothetical protein
MAQGSPPYCWRHNCSPLRQPPSPTGFWGRCFRITATSWEDRKIGTSNNVHLLVQCAWIATANNAVLSGEISRGLSSLALTPRRCNRGLERFPIFDLRGWARENRAKLVWAALPHPAWIGGRPIPRIFLPSGCSRNGLAYWRRTHHVGILFLNNRSTLYNSSEAKVRRSVGSLMLAGNA